MSYTDQRTEIAHHDVQKGQVEAGKMFFFTGESATKIKGQKHVKSASQFRHNFKNKF